MLQMTFLCEYRVNQVEVWRQPAVPQYSTVHRDDQWVVETLQPTIRGTNQQRTTTQKTTLWRTTTQKTTLSRPTISTTLPQPSRRTTIPPQRFFTIFSLPTTPSVNIAENLVEVDNRLVSSVSIGLQGEDNTIEVIASNRDSVIIRKIEEPDGIQVTKADDTSWSIFQFLKNVIQMPTLLRSNSISMK